jgi:glycosyltransferase involved in cell wall biosynthesis
MLGQMIPTEIKEARQTAGSEVQHRRKVLVLVTHVVQYASPTFRMLASDPRLDVTVVYCSMQGAESGMDPEFGIEIRWDEPLLDGYQWVHIPNKSLRPGLGRFFGLWNPGLWKLIRTSKSDAMVIYTGYMNASFWLAVLAAKFSKTAIVFASDTTTLQARDGSGWKTRIKPVIVGGVYKFAADVLMASSEITKNLALKLGLPEERVSVTRSGTNKEAWVARTKKFDRAATRSELNLPTSAPVVFYCAKLQEWKRPLDLLNGFAQADVANAYVVFAGEGPQKQELIKQAEALGIADRVRVLGFVNLSQLPALYNAADLFALPSRFDNCPLVVPEAMFSGFPVILSDAVEGRLNMIREGQSGYVYRCGDIDSLAKILRRVLSDSAHLEQLKKGVSQQMESWTIEDFLDSWNDAVERAIVHLHGGSGRPRQV